MDVATAAVIWWLVGFACGIIAMLIAMLWMTHGDEADSEAYLAPDPFLVREAARPMHPKPAPPPPQNQRRD